MKKLVRINRNFQLSLPVPTVTKGITIFNGSNGCGKTTLLRLLAGKHKIKTRNNMNPAYESMFQNVSLFFESSMLAQEETLKTNIAYLNSLLSLNSSLANQLIKDLNLIPIINTKYNQCSTGEKKKFLTVLNLSQSFKDIYFLDEPFENIDMKSKENLVQILKSPIFEDKTIFISSHQPEVLKKVSHQIINFDTPN